MRVALSFRRQGGHLNWGQFATSFMWPPAQLADFVLGVVASQVHQAACRSDWGRPSKYLTAILGDVALVSFGAAVVMLPSPKSRAECQTDANVLLNHGGALISAIFMCAPRGLFARLLSHPALVALGKYSFEVYLFQWPLQAIFRQCQRWPSNETFMTFLLILWLLAGLYVEFLVEPMTSFFRPREAPDPHGKWGHGETRS